MKAHIEELFKYPRYLLGAGYNKAINYINSVIPLETIEVESGTDLGNGWVVPEEWVIRDAWVKFNGEKILDFTVDPLCVSDYSTPVHEKMDREQLLKHLNTKDYYMDVNSNGNATPYNYHFYEKKWSFNIPFEKVWGIEGCKDGVCTTDLKGVDPEVGKVQIEGVTENKYVNLLEEGEYEVFIDSEFKKGAVQVGVHTIKGKTDREVLLFAHLDHPYQANDNLSSVGLLMDLVEKIKDAKYEHTVKVIFCPETIGSIAYAKVADISKVDFVMAFECIGNDGDLYMQKSFDNYDRLNFVMHLAAQDCNAQFQKAPFRKLIGSDEYVFNDPAIGVPGILFTRYPFKGYHSSDDTPEKLNYEKIEEVGRIALKTIEYWEKDYVPERDYKGVLFRSKYEAHTPSKLANLDIDYFLWGIDGKKYVSQILLDERGQLMLSFNWCLELLEKLKKNGLIKKNSRTTRSQKAKRTTKK